jgi:hypothetical protein
MANTSICDTGRGYAKYKLLLLYDILSERRKTKPSL